MCILIIKPYTNTPEIVIHGLELGLQYDEDGEPKKKLQAGQLSGILHRAMT